MMVTVNTVYVYGYWEYIHCMQNKMHSNSNIQVNHSLLDDIEELWPPQRVPKFLYSVLCAFMALITITAVTLNGVVISVTYRFKVLRKPINVVMLNLCVADFFNALIGGTIAILANAAGYFFLGQFVCTANGFIVGVLGVTNLISIVFLSFTRYLIICKPFGDWSFQKRHAYHGIAFTWMWSLFWHIPPLFWHGYSIEGVGTSCAPNYRIDSDIANRFLLAYFFLCFFLPLLVMTFSYGMIIRSVCLSSRNSSVPRSASQKNEDKTLKMVVIVMIAFLFCWSPYAILAVFTTANRSVKIDAIVATIPAYFAKTATIYNPVIYFALNNKFRKSVIRILVQKADVTFPSSHTT